MKIKNTFLLVLFTFCLWNCNKDDESPSYSIDEMITDDILAHYYFHTIFREAENSWAVMDDKKYSTDTIKLTSGSSKKTISFNDETNMITIKYNAWFTEKTHQLVGTMSVRLPDKFYRVTGKAATVTLTDFSINGQLINGSSTMTYSADKEKENDIYSYLLSGGKIFTNDDKSIILTADISGAKYERTKGAATLAQYEDDEWAYTGTMKGMLRDDHNNNYVANAGTKTETQDNRLYYTGNCIYKGRLTFQITNQPNAYSTFTDTCIYNVVTITDVDK